MEAYASTTRCSSGTYGFHKEPQFLGLNLCGFLTPPVARADFLAAFVASCFLGALPPVDLRAVCLVNAIFRLKIIEKDARVLGYV